MEAAITWELTARRFFSWLSPSTSFFTVAFLVDRKDPKFLYRMNTTLTCPAHWRERNIKKEEEEKMKQREYESKSEGKKGRCYIKREIQTE